MHALAPCSLDSASLAGRLRDLAGDERQVQVDFLLHLDEFDRRQEYLAAGFGSLWDFCLRELHLREGAAGRRIAAMRALRRFPRLESPLRDGRICLSTAPLLAQVLTEETFDDLVAQAAFRTKAEVEHLVASIQPRTAPRDGLRKLPEARAASLAQPQDGIAEAPSLLARGTEDPRNADGDLAAVALTASAVVVRTHTAPARASSPPAELRAVSGDEWSLRVTIDGALKADLESLAALLSHKVRRNDYAALLREAVRCGIEKHGKRRGAVPPSRKRAKPAPSETNVADSSRRIPAEVKRAVFERDGGCCAWVSKDGRRCGSRWQLEYDHIKPVSQGGKSTVENVRVACRAHNFFHAEETHGRAHMAKFRREPPGRTQAGESAIAGDSDSQCNDSRTASQAWSDGGLSVSFQGG
ncbi:MAG TPA: HNH endonuclease [Anaeromyxobacteraceae bacterium]|nr:HNH endonuclease [Anaeromyxobacteraceae bacterium]